MRLPLPATPKRPSTPRELRSCCCPMRPWRLPSRAMNLATTFLHRRRRGRARRWLRLRVQHPGLTGTRRAPVPARGDELDRPGAAAQRRPPREDRGAGQQGSQRRRLHAPPAGRRAQARRHVRGARREDGAGRRQGADLLGRGLRRSEDGVGRARATRATPDESRGWPETTILFFYLCSSHSAFLRGVAASAGARPRGGPPLCPYRAAAMSGRG